MSAEPGGPWLKVSFGTNSKEGDRFVERVLPAFQTLRLRSSCSLDFIEATIRLTRSITQSHSCFSRYNPRALNPLRRGLGGSSRRRNRGERLPTDDEGCSHREVVTLRANNRR